MLHLSSVFSVLVREGPVEAVWLWNLVIPSFWLKRYLCSQVNSDFEMPKGRKEPRLKSPFILFRPSRSIWNSWARDQIWVSAASTPDPLRHCARLGVEHVSWCCRDPSDPLAPHWELQKATLNGIHWGYSFPLGEVKRHLISLGHTEVKFRRHIYNCRWEVWDSCRKKKKKGQERVGGKTSPNSTFNQQGTPTVSPEINNTPPPTCLSASWKEMKAARTRFTCQTCPVRGQWVSTLTCISITWRAFERRPPTSLTWWGCGGPEHSHFSHPQEMLIRLAQRRRLESHPTNHSRGWHTFSVKGQGMVLLY